MIAHKKRMTVGAVGLLCALSVGALPAVASAAGGFGVESFENVIQATSGGALATQAGSHPYQMTTSIVFNHQGEGVEAEPIGGSVKNVEVNMPRGLVINPTATDVRCTEAELEEEPTTPRPHHSCPEASAVGVAKVLLAFLGEVSAPIYNMVTPPGVPGEFAFNVAGLGAIVHLVGRVRTGEDYGLSAEAVDTSEKLKASFAKVTLWGSPSDESHDKDRGYCATSAGQTSVAEEEVEAEEELAAKGGVNPRRTFFCAVARNEKALLTMPSDCAGPLQTTARVDSWQEPEFGPLVFASSPAVTGCERLDFSPRLSITPTSSATASPTGLDVDLTVPQSQSPVSLAEANLKDAVVTLPAGMTISASAANGLAACSPAQISLHTAAKPSCPEQAKVGVAEVSTPLLEKPLNGAIYLAQQETFEGSLIAFYLVAEGSGALLKLGGSVALDPASGQITATVDNNPELPFDDVKLHFFGGSGAALVTPAGCGSYSTSSQLTPWSGGVAATPTSSFAITEGCGAAGFSPGMVAGTTNNQAGAFSPFSLVLSRPDGDQDLRGFEVALPPGLLAKIAGVPQCTDGQANAGDCPGASQIGTVTVSAGVGPRPVSVQGRIFLTGPYNGGPFGEAVEVPAVAGPFDLDEGKPVVVRGSIHIDPTTASASVISDAFPTMLRGIPLHVRTVAVSLDRPAFVLNPTSCIAQTISGVARSLQGAVEPVSSPFEAANCAALAFKPTLTAASGARTSKLNGASLTVKVGQRGGEANIHKVTLQLPAQLPSRLTTLQKACLAAQFETNPAGCPAGSVIGTGTAVTPLLDVPLTGPAYIVSHGGAAFPDVEFVLSGQGVRIILDGKTDIKKGITFSRFESVPDAPISSFQATLPEGPHSILAANGNLCAQPLSIPTTITAQNGAVLTQTTPVAVSGCPKGLSILSKTAKRRELSLSVYVPTAGKLKIAGRGLVRGSQTTKTRTTVKVRIRPAGRGRVSTTAKIVFTPASGRPLTKKLPVRFAT